jgi:hypothetical protein
METTFVEKRVGNGHRQGNAAVTLAFAVLGLGFVSSPALCAPALFKENWVDKAKCQKSRGGDVQCEEISSGKLTIKSTVTPEDPGATGTPDPSQFDPTTPFDITIGNFSYAGTLGGDPKYVAGRNHATLLLTGEVCDANGQCKENVKHGYVLLSMTKKGLKVSISTLTGADALGNSYETPIVANNFDGQTTGPVTDALSARIDLGDFSYSTDDAGCVVAVAGKVKTKAVVARDGSDVNLSQVYIEGTVASQP